MRKTARPVVWEGAGAQSQAPDPITGKIGEALERAQSTFQPSAFRLQPLLAAPITDSLARFLSVSCWPPDREQG